MPAFMNEDGVCADAQYLCACLFEFAVILSRFLQFRRADKGEIGRVKEQHEPFAMVVRKFYLFDFVVLINLEFEVVDLLADSCLALFLPWD